VAVLPAWDSSRSYSDQKPSDEVRFGAKGAAAWRGGWPKVEAASGGSSKASSGKQQVSNTWQHTWH
jgi:hypothetical protein